MHWITTNPSGFHGVDSLDAIALLGRFLATRRLCLRAANFLLTERGRHERKNLIG